MRGRRSSGRTTTAGLDAQELRDLFGEPVLLRKTTLRFDLAQLLGRHALIADALTLVPPLRSHLLGIWSYPGEGT
jgi:hypothetical protein